MVLPATSPLLLMGRKVSKSPSGVVGYGSLMI